jgi:hypothetical protein
MSGFAEKNQNTRKPKSLINYKYKKIDAKNCTLIRNRASKMR